MEPSCYGDAVDKAVIKDNLWPELSSLVNCVVGNRERGQRLGQARILRLESESLELSHSQDKNIGDDAIAELELFHKSDIRS